MPSELSPADLLIPLDVPPSDARDAGDVLDEADAVIYRLGLRSMLVLNLPDRLDVGGVRVDVVDGPVLAQRTAMRQRAGVLRPTFDKHMVREPVGDGERIAILSIHESPLPDDLEAAFLVWRQRAEAAAGALSAVLDERVVGARLFEDAVLRAGDVTIGAIDIQERVRSFLPFEVTSLDRPALAALAGVSLGDGSLIARAARLHRRAALEGPTADAYVALFLAAESLLDTRQPRKVDLDAILTEAGIDPDGLPLHTGLLIDLRGKIVHEGLEDHERLRTAYYEMEGIVRALIRQTAGLRGGWYPGKNLAAYATPWPDRVAASDGTPRSDWHDDGLPPVSEPAPERLPRAVLPPDREVLVTVSDGLKAAAGPHAELLAIIAADARMRLLPDDGDELTLELGIGNGFDIEPHRILVGSDRLQKLDDVARLVALTVDFSGAMGHWVAMRSIGGSSDTDVALRSAIASWDQYVNLVIDGDLPPELLKLPSLETPTDIGVIAGWAAAGDERASGAVDALTGGPGELARATRDKLRASPPGPPRPVLK
jgi:hypothetical protein